MVMELEKVPPELIFNWDHIGINIVAGSPFDDEGEKVETNRSC